MAVPFKYFICFRGDNDMGGAIAQNVYDTLFNIYHEKTFFSSAKEMERGKNYREQEIAAIKQAETFIVILSNNFLSRITNEEDEVRFELITASQRDNIKLCVVSQGNFQWSDENKGLLRSVVGLEFADKIIHTDYIIYNGVRGYHEVAEKQLITVLGLDARFLGLYYDNNDTVSSLKKQLESRLNHSGSYYLGKITEELYPTLDMMDRTILDEKDNLYATNQLFNLLKSNPNEDYIMIGDGGIGKTVLLMQTCKVLLEQKCPAYYLPLHELHDKRIKDHIKQYNTELWDKLFDLPYVVLLLDGFNEVSDSLKGEVLREINELSIRSNIQVVMTSRFDPRQFDLSFVGFKIIKLKPLSKEQIARYLTGCNLALPEDENTLSILSYPLLLTLYTNAIGYEQTHGMHMALRWLKNPCTNGAIIWDFLQTQVHKSVFGLGNRNKILHYVFIVEYVLPYIGLYMVNHEVFEITESELIEAIKVCLSLYRNKWQQGLPARLENLSIQFNNESLEYNISEAFIALTLNLHLVHKNYNMRYAFFHQHFRDCFAAIHMINCIEGEKDIPTEFKKWVDSNILKLISELTVCEQINSLFDRLRGIEINTYDHSLVNAISIYEFQHGKDFRNFNFSGIDLRNVSLRDYNVEGACFDGAYIGAVTFLQHGHNGSIYCIALSKDGSYFASGSYDNKIMIWDTLTASLQKICLGHKGAVVSLSIDEEENLYSCSSDHTVWRWNAAEGLGNKIYEHSTGLKKLLCYRASNLFLLDENKHLFLFNISTNVVEKLPFEEVTDICLSEEDEILAISHGSHYISLIDAASHAVISTGNTDTQISSLAFMKGGNTLFCGGHDGAVLRISTDNFIVHTIGKHNGQINVTKQLNDKYIATASNDKTIMIWDFANGECVKILNSHYRGVFALEAIENAKVKLLISGSDDNTIKLWNSESGVLLKTIEGYTNWINGITKAKDKNILMTVSGDTSVRLWGSKDFKWQYTLLNHTDWVYCGAISHDGSIAITGACDNSIIIWNLNKKSASVQMMISKQEVKSVAISQDGRICASAAADGRCCVLDARTGKMIACYEELGAEIYCVKMAADGSKIILSTSTHKIVIFDVLNNSIVKVLEEAHKDKIHCVDITDDFSVMVSGGNDGVVRLWDINKGTMLKEYGDCCSKVRSIALSQDGKTCAVGLLDGNIVILDVHNMAKRHCIKAHNGEVRTVVFLDIKTLVSGGSDSLINCYSVRRGKKIKTTKPEPLMRINHCSFIGARFTDASLRTAIENNGGIVN